MESLSNRVYTISHKSNEEKQVLELDQVLELVGVGWYNVRYCLLFALFLIASIMEVVGYSYILPAARCDLQMNDAQRGLIGSMPYIAIVVTSYPWGYLVDTRGRKNIIIISSLGAGILGAVAAFMPNLISFTICKLLGSLCLACPGAVPYAFIGEILPMKHRDIALSVTNAMQAFGSTMIPILAWIILPLDFKFDFGLYYFRSWRLLTILYSSIFILCSILMCFGPESPKYLVSTGRYEEALQVLKLMFYGNRRNPSVEFPVSSLKVDPKIQALAEDKSKQSFFSSLKIQTLPLMRPPFLKWLTLNGVLLFGIFATLNGLMMWVPDILNRVLTGSAGGEMTACTIIRQNHNETLTNESTCNDEIDVMIFKISSIANSVVSVIMLVASMSLKMIGKKTLLMLVYFIIGSFCISINFVKKDIIFAVLLSSIPITALGIGPINAYAVQIFPTALRGMAVSLALMLGRSGSVFGTNIAGLLINTHCESMFYLFGGLLIFCGFLAILLPNSKK